MNDEKYAGWTNWDTWATWSVLTNTKRSYDWLLNWKKNFERKLKKGTFDMKKAELVVKKYLIPTARGKGRWVKVFKADRYEDFTPEPDINPKKVNLKEIVEAILNL